MPVSVPRKISEKETQMGEDERRKRFDILSTEQTHQPNIHAYLPLIKGYQLGVDSRDSKLNAVGSVKDLYYDKR
jgi:hypothetical protein